MTKNREKYMPIDKSKFLGFKISHKEVQLWHKEMRESTGLSGI